ncbi:MAG: N-acetylglucosamine-6-phosphate deacetylase [Luteolibacter sp.]
MKTLLRHAHLISPGLDIADGAVLLEDGRIAAVFEDCSDLPAADEVIDISGRIVMPGFIDIHSHGADGCDVCDDNETSIPHIAMRKLQEGVTTWLPTTLTQPQEKIESIAAHCAAYMAEPKFCRAPGMHVEGPFINRANAGAQNPEFVRPPNVDELERIHAIAPAQVLSIAPDMDGADLVIERATALGITCSAAHTSATAAQIFDAKTAGLRHLTHFCNAMTPLHHREIGVVGAGLLDNELMIEVIGDTIHLSPDMLKLIFKLVPIERLMLITDSTAASWIGEGEVNLGGLACIVSNGRAVLKEGGALAGSALLFNDGLRNVARLTGLPLDQLVKATSWNQARSLGLDGLGKIEPGYHADLVILDEDFNVLQTFVNGNLK